MLLLAYALTFGALAIHPRERDAWALENLVPFLELLACAIYYRWVELTRASYVLIFVHLVVQMIGGHYTYAEVPLFNWLRDEFGWSRNHYDRVAHFAVGFCLYVPVREICLRRSPLAGSKAWTSFFVYSVLTAVAGIWEVWEWLVAEWAYSDLGTAYLGTQGDAWDAQKDILLAPVGAVAAALLFTRWHNRLLKGLPQKWEARLKEPA